jgi:hypothetical protein
MLKKIKLLAYILLLSPLLSHTTPTLYNDEDEYIKRIKELEENMELEQAASVVTCTEKDKPPRLSSANTRILRDAASLFFTPDDHLITAAPFATLYLYVFDKEYLKITQDSPIAELLAEPEAYEAKVELALLHYLFKRMQVRNLEIDFKCFPLEFHEKFLTTIMQNTFTKTKNFYNYLS